MLLHLCVITQVALRPFTFYNFYYAHWIKLYIMFILFVER